MKKKHKRSFVKLIIFTILLSPCIRIQNRIRIRILIGQLIMQIFADPEPYLQVLCNGVSIITVDSL